jgi:hypothetical protein
MSVNFIPILVDEKVLTDTIQLLTQTLPPEKIDEAIQDLWFNDSLPGDKSEYRFAFRGFEAFDNHSFWVEADPIRFQILFGAWKSGNGVIETIRSADALYQFLPAFYYGWSATASVNDYGLPSSCAISPINARRLHELFKQIDFELLKPIFEEHCRGQYYLPEKLEKYSWIPSIEVLKNYAAAFDGLVAEVATKNKVLYMWAS